MKIYFDHEKLGVYREAIDFCGWVGELLSTITLKAAAKDHLDRASTSVPLNIAEGNGKFSYAARARFFEISRGSTLECAALFGCTCCSEARDTGANHRAERATRANGGNAGWVVAQVFETGGHSRRGRILRSRARVRLQARPRTRCS